MNKNFVIPHNTKVSQHIINKEMHIINQWLRARAHRSERTFESYANEAQKLINWAYGNKNLAFIDLTIEDASNYLDFLHTYVSNNSVKYARTVLVQLFGYSYDYGYLQKNVFKLTAVPKIIHCSDHVEKYLDIDAWAWLWRWLTTRPAKKDSELRFNIRNRWLFALIYHTGIRRHEVANTNMSDFIFKSNRWVLKITGKGNKVRFVSVNSVLLQELKKYRLFYHLPELPTAKDKFGLIFPLKGNQIHLTPRAIGKMIQTVRELAVLDCDNEYVLVQIQDMTTHWMRHTNATHRRVAGADLETIQDEQGHADPKTTRIYLHTLATERQKDAEKLADFSNSLNSL